MATLYAIKNGVYAYNYDTSNQCSTTNFQINKCSVVWWLRSPGYDTNLAADVDDYGYVSDFGGNVYVDDSGVRPALRLKY